MKNKFITLAVATIMLVMATTVTAFAATGIWHETDTSWEYLDKYGEATCDAWVKFNGNYYYLDDNGLMVKSDLISYNDNYYYVSSEGNMLQNVWVKVDNDDIEDRWMFFGSNGKAVKSGWKKIADKYFFFEDYCMNYGFLDADGKMIEDDDAWKTAVYYCGEENVGARYSGWLAVTCIGEDDGYVYFGSNGKKVTGTKRINEFTYIFNDDGKMITEWNEASPSTASASSIDKYYREDGTLVKSGWIYANPEDGDEPKWFYAKSNGEIVKDCVRKINDKYYAFDEDGIMLTGIVELDADGKPIKATSLEDIKKEDMFEATNDYMYFAENDDPMLQGAAYLGKKVLNASDEAGTVLFSDARGVAYANGEQIKKGYLYINSVLYAFEDPTKKYEIRTVNGINYVINCFTGKASKSGTFTDTEEGIRFKFVDGQIGIWVKDSNDKWTFKEWF